MYAGQQPTIITTTPTTTVSQPQHVSLACPSTLAVALDASLRTSFPPPLIASTTVSVETDPTGQQPLRETLELAFAGDVVSFERLLMHYATFMISGAGAAATTGGDGFCAVYCMTAEQLAVATRLAGGPFGRSVLVLRGAGFQMFSASPLTPPVPMRTAVPLHSTTQQQQQQHLNVLFNQPSSSSQQQQTLQFNDYKDMLSKASPGSLSPTPSSASGFGMQYHPHLGALSDASPSLDGGSSHMGSPLFNTVDFDLSSLLVGSDMTLSFAQPPQQQHQQRPSVDMTTYPLSPSTAPTPSPSTTTPSPSQQQQTQQHTTTTIILRRAREHASTLDTLTDQIRRLTSTLLPTRLARPILTRLDTFPRASDSAATTTALMVVAASTASTESKVFSMQRIGGGAARSGGGGGVIGGMAVGNGPASRGAPVRVPRSSNSRRSTTNTTNATAAAGKKPTWQQSRSKDAWQFQSYFKVDMQ